MSHRGLHSLLDELTRLTALPLELGETLPGGAYSSEDFYRLEREHVFRSDWLCAGHVNQVARPGDYLRTDVLGEPLVVTRDEDGALHALSRVCRHRFMDVLPPETTPEQGSSKRLTCPYHTWTYRLNGGDRTPSSGRGSGHTLPGPSKDEMRGLRGPGVAVTACTRRPAGTGRPRRTPGTTPAGAAGRRGAP
ncbi:Rieske (2Fe-2S) protein [Streptomyces sp. NPDC006339]|uniref:aromatic ring-hydroxylating oxygenase subunit alpha n=1 Tax=Streptomyces sp. NPDC006339 TaxID=3156755 RepID=UPI0033A672AB